MHIQTPASALRKAIAIAAFTLAALPLSSYAAAGDPIGPAVRVDSGAGSYVSGPVIARDGVGNTVVVWGRMDYLDLPTLSIHARRYDASGQPLGAEFTVPLPGGTPGVAMDADGNFVVLSSSHDVATKRSHIQFQRYAADGSAQGAAVEVTSAADLTSYAPLAIGIGLSGTIAMTADGDFVVVWSRLPYAEYGTGFSSVRASAGTTAIHARRYHANGSSNGLAKLVHSDLPDILVVGGSVPVVAMNADGGFVTAWTNYDLYRSSIEYRRYNAQGWAQGLTTRANPRSIQWARRAAIAVDPAGAFTIVWGDSDNSGNGPAYVRAQRYSNTGAAQAGAIVVDAGRAGGSAVGMQPGGDFVVAWARYDDSIGGTVLVAQRYAANGSAQGGNFQINSAMPIGLSNPAVAVDGYGDFAFAWKQSASSGTSDSGIYLRLYRGN